MNTQITATPKLFIGMDVHKKSWTCHFKTDLFDYKSVTMPPVVQNLQEYVQKNFQGHEVSCCYEAGCCGYWIARYFQQLKWNVLVVNPADVPRINKQNWQKTDKIDARILCSYLATQSLHSIFIPSEQQEQLRSLYRRRIHLVQQLRTIKSHIKSQLLYFGIELPAEYDNPNWSHCMKQWITDLQWKYPTAKESLHSKLRQLDFLWYETLHVSNELRAYCRKYFKNDYYLLKSVPGIGGITASALLAELGDIRRFNRSKQLAAAIGIVPGIYQSSETNINLGLTRRSNKQLRSLIIEASWTAVRTDMALQQYYRKHAALEPNKAIVKVAHRLVNRIRAVIISGVPYQCGLMN